jgi:isocitrate dehydrogenase
VTLVQGNIMKFTEGAFRDWGYALAERDSARPIDGGPWPAKQHDAGDRHQGRHRRRLPPADPAPARRVRCDRHAQSERRLHLRRPRRPGRRIGIAPGGNVNYVTGHAVFEATHGTAPKYANLDRVNPGSVILSGEMMLRYMGWTDAADRIITGLEATLAQKVVTYDFARLMEGAKEVKCSEFATAVVENMKKL